MDGQRRGIRGEHTVLWNALFKFSENFLFEVQIFEHRFDDHVALFEIVHRRLTLEIGHDAIVLRAG